jgi:hypothetical protein
MTDPTPRQFSVITDPQVEQIETYYIQTFSKHDIQQIATQAQAAIHYWARLLDASLAAIDTLTEKEHP